MMKALVLLFLAHPAVGSGLGSAGHPDKNAGSLVSTVLQMNTRQSEKLLGKLKEIPTTPNDIASLVLQGGLQWMHDLSNMDDTSQEMAFAKLERYEDADGLSKAQKDLAGFGKALGEYTKETKGTDEYPPKILEEYLITAMKTVGSSNDLVQQVEDAIEQVEEAVEESQPPDTAFVEVEHWDQGGGTLIPKEFAASVASLSQKLQAQQNLPEGRKHMLDGMAKKFAVGVLLASAAAKDTAEKATAL